MPRYSYRQQRLEAIRNAGRIRRISSFGSYQSGTSAGTKGTSANSIKSSSKFSIASAPPPPPPPPLPNKNKMSMSKSEGRDGILRMKSSNKTTEKLRSSSSCNTLDDDMTQYPEPVVVSTFSTAPSSSFETASSIDESLDEHGTFGSIRPSSSGIISSSSSFESSTAAGVGAAELKPSPPTFHRTNNNNNVTKTMTNPNNQQQTVKSTSDEIRLVKQFTPAPTSVFRRRNTRSSSVMSAKSTSSATLSISGAAVSFIGIGGARELKEIDSQEFEAADEEVLDEDDHVEDSQRIPKSVFFFTNDTNHKTLRSTQVGRSWQQLDSFEDEPLENIHHGGKNQLQQAAGNNMTRINKMINGLVRFGGLRKTTSSSYHSRTTTKSSTSNGTSQPSTTKDALPLGTRCLVLKGTESDDVGQEAVVIGHTPKRVKISYLNPKGEVTQKLKDPSSLVGFDDDSGNNKIKLYEDPVTRQLWITTTTSTTNNGP